MAGTVRLSVPDFMGIEVIPAMLARLQRAHPQISIEMVLSNAPANLLAQEVDVAVRTITPQQEALVARKVATIPLGFFASPDYLARRGHPASIAALDTHDFIGPDRQRGDLALVESLNLRGRIVLRTDSHPAMLSAARAGLGIAVAQVPVASADPRLARVLPGIVLAHLDTWLVTHENLARVPRVRAVLDALAAAFREMV
ncbi:substrate binding domain-containing protein [Pararhodobacter sp.]|uniref:substrate binding domain-containing protein n=1 Tax=Pararhodobacter sp. TaxID=2127056 RepID=UPI002FDE7583